MCVSFGHLYLSGRTLTDAFVQRMDAPPPGILSNRDGILSNRDTRQHPRPQQPTTRTPTTTLNNSNNNTAPPLSPSALRPAHLYHKCARVSTGVSMFFFKSVLLHNQEGTTTAKRFLEKLGDSFPERYWLVLAPLGSKHR